MNPYAANSTKGTGMVRVVTDMTEDLVSEIDAWGVPAGCRSRAEAIRTLLKKGLSTEKATVSQE